MKRLFTLLVIALLLLSLPVLPSLAEDASSKKVEINYYTWHDEDDYMPAIVEAFNAQSKTTHVNYTSYPSTNSEYAQKMTILLSSGASSGIDVLGVNGSDGYMAKYSRGVLLGLNELIAKTAYDITPYGSLFAQYAIDGEYYALPHRRTTWMLFYNKDLFDAAGLSYPDNLTWNQFCELAATMTSGEGADKQWGCYPSMANYGWYAMATQKGGNVVADDLTPIKDGLEVLYRMYYVDKSAMPFAEAISLNNGRQLFEQGNVAMMPAGEWTIAMLLADEEKGKVSINWDIASMPVFDGVSNGTSWGQGTFTGITSFCPNPENAFEFLTYACGPEGAKIVASRGILPGYNSAEVEKVFVESSKHESASKIFEWDVNMEIPIHPSVDELNTAMREEVHLYLLDEVDIDTCIENLYARRAEILAQ